MATDNLTKESQDIVTSPQDTTADRLSADGLDWLSDCRPMQCKLRETLPGLKRDTFYPEGYIDLLNPPADYGDGHTGVFSLSSLTGNDDFLPQREIDELEGRSFFDRPIVANIVTLLMTAGAVALLLWAIFAL